MNARVYMLLDIMEDKAAYAMEILRAVKGVVIADTLEGHPNFLVIMEAVDRQRLVELMMPVLDSLDHVTENVHLLVNRENKLVPCFLGVDSIELLQKQSVN
ncbi:MAG: hypothetical protein ACYDG5_05305 [Dehalococcoidales bacterium]